MIFKNQKGFSIVEVVLVIIVLAILVLVGWLFYKNTNQMNKSTDQTTQQSKNEVPEVKNTEDLKKTEDYLKQSDIDKQLDTSEIDSALNE